MTSAGLRRRSSCDGRSGDAGDIRIDSSPEPLQKGLLHPAIFAAVKTEDDHTAAWLQGAGQIGEELVQDAALVIHGDAQGLEAALKRCSGLRCAAVKAGREQDASDDFGELSGAA